MGAVAEIVDARGGGPAAGAADGKAGDRAVLVADRGDFARGGAADQGQVLEAEAEFGGQCFQIVGGGAEEDGDRHVRLEDGVIQLPHGLYRVGGERMAPANGGRARQ